jgi:hypothetical protein
MHTALSKPKRNAFVAAPMASLGTDAAYVENHSFVLGFLHHLEMAEFFGAIYYAGRQIHSPSQFQRHSDALLTDYRALLDSDVFIMLYPAPVLSSVLVEAGIALGLKKEIYLVCRRSMDLPFILREAPSTASELPKITIIEWVQATPDPSVVAEQMLKHYAHGSGLST